MLQIAFLAVIVVQEHFTACNEIIVWVAYCYHDSLFVEITLVIMLSKLGHDSHGRAFKQVRVDDRHSRLY